MESIWELLSASLLRGPQLDLDQESSNPGLEGRCPAGFRCVPASSYLSHIQFVISHKPLLFSANFTLSCSITLKVLFVVVVVTEEKFLRYRYFCKELY